MTVHTTLLVSPSPTIPAMPWTTFSPPSRTTVATNPTIAAPMTNPNAITVLRHHGRVSVTAKARFSVSVSAEKTFEPAQRVSNAPTEMAPDAPLANTTSLTTPAISVYASAGTAGATFAMIV